MKKTNAMRILDQSKIKYEIIEYDKDNGISGIEVARQLGEDEKLVYKTLVTHAKDNHFVFVIPVGYELDLKLAANVSGTKKIEMIKQADLLHTTGYIHGGCSPIGMKKQFMTYIDISAEEKEFIYVSGGKIGLQIKINPKEIKQLIGAEFAKITKERLNGI